MPKLTKDIRIRKATFDDAPEIFKMGEKSFKSYGTEDWAFTLVAEFLEEYPLFSFVAIKGKKVVAFVLSRPYEESTTKFYINWIAVNPKLKGKGIGTGLIEKVTEVAKTKGFRSIVVDTQHRNVRMQNVLDKAGFTPVEREIYYSKKIK